MRSINQEGVLIFFHIGKTAGTTLSHILNRNFPKEVRLYMNFGSNSQCVDELKHLPEKQKLQIKYFHAHMLPFGIHEFFPQSGVYITLLRHPVKRVISAYQHIIRFPAHPMHDKLVSNRISFHDYLVSGVALPEVQSGQTRILSGIKGVDWITGAGPLSPYVLEKAQENLRQHFALAGITERFDEALILLKRLMGWNYLDILYQKKNVAPRRVGPEDLPQDTLKILEAYNEWDLKLYDFAQRNLDEVIKSQDGSFAMELRLFRLLNQLYNQYAGSRAALRSWRTKFKVATLLI